MTVTATNRKNQFTTNGVTTEFTFNFAITDTSQVNAFTVVDGVEAEYTNFTVELSDDIEGGVLTTGDTLSGVDLLIYRDVDFTQQVDYEDGGKFPADSHEQALDKLTLQNQDQQEEIDRSVKSSISNDSSYTVDELEEGSLIKFEDGTIKSSSITESYLTGVVGEVESARDETIDAAVTAAASRDEAVEARDDAVEAAEGNVRYFSSKDGMISSNLLSEGQSARVFIFDGDLRDYVIFSSRQKDSDVELDSGLFASPVKNRIAVLGDSITQSSYGRSDDWVSEIQKKLTMTNTPAEIKNFAVGGVTLASAITKTNAIGNKSMIETMSNWDADDVIVALGFNDCITSTIDETEAELRVDNIISAIRDDNPNRRILFVKQVIWDSTVGTPTTGVYGWTNKSVIPLQHTLDTDGQYNKIVKDDHLDLLVTDARVDKYATLAHMHAYMESLTAEGIATGTYNMEIWQTCRLGWHVDGLHPSKNAHKSYAANVADNLSMSLFDKDYEGLKSAQSPTNIFRFSVFWDSIMSSAGSGFSKRWRLSDSSGNLGNWGTYYADDMVRNVSNWYFPQKNLSVYIQKSVYNADSPVSIIITGIPSRTAILGLWYSGSSTFGSNILKYNSSTGNDNGTFIYTFIPRLLFPTIMTEAGTYTTGVRIQNGNMGKAAYYDFFFDIEIEN